MKTTTTNTRSKGLVKNITIGFTASILLIASSISCVWASEITEIQTVIATENEATAAVGATVVTEEAVVTDETVVTEEAVVTDETAVNEETAVTEETVLTDETAVTESTETVAPVSVQLENAVDEMDITSVRGGCVLNLNWSIKYDGSPVKAGDYFTVVIPNNNYKNINYSGEIADGGEIIANYTAVNDGTSVIITFTFTDYVENYSNVSGNFWCGM